MALHGSIRSGSISEPIGVSGSVIFANEPAATFPSLPGADASFFVSGNIGDANGTKLGSGVAIFGGDTVVSGNLHISTDSRKLIFGTDVTKTYVKSPGLNALDMSGDIVRFGADISNHIAPGTDTNFFASGSIGSKNTATKGTAIFGGDMVVSGTIYNASGIEVGGGGWTDDGTIVRLQTVTDKVGIGTISPTTKFELEVGDAENLGGMFIDFNETGQYVALDIDSESDQAALRTDGKYGAILTQSISNGAGLMVYRNIAEVGIHPLVTFTENHATSNQPTLKIINKGDGHSIIAQQASDTVFRVEQTGRVVIGDGGGDQGMLIDAGASASGSVGFSKSSGTTGAEVSFDSGENLVLRNFTNNEDIIFYAADNSVDTEVMRIDGSAASVAIGVNSNTVAKLKIHVTDGDSIDGLEIVNADAGQKAIDIDSAGAGIEINGKECLTVTVDEDAGYGAIFARNKGASAVADPLVKIRDQDGDQSALKVIQESTNTSAYAIEVGNAGGTKTSISGSGQVGIGTGTSTYNATLHVRSHIGGTGIVLEEDGGGDTCVKIYDSADDGVVDVYANNSVTGRIHGNGDSYLSGPFGIGTTGPSSPLTVEDSATVDIAKIRNTANSAQGAIITVENNRGGSGTGAAEDYCGAFRFQAQDSGQSIQQYAKITGVVDAATAGAEFGRIDFEVTGDAVTTVKPLVLRSDKVHILSGGAASSIDEAQGLDVSFYVSGSQGSKGTVTKGTSVFGGDVYVSGTLYADSASGFVNGAGAATRLAYWADADTLMSNSGLHFNGFKLGLTGSAASATSALDVDRIYTGTTSNTTLTSHAGASGILVDYGVTGVVASGQYQKHNALWIKYDQSAPTHIGMIQGTGLSIEVTGSDTGVSQTTDGIRVSVADPGSFSNNASRGISVTAPAGWVAGEVNASHIRCHDMSTTNYFDISVGVDGNTQLTTLDSAAANAHLNLKPDGKVLILSGGGVTSPNEAAGADVVFYVSGSTKQDSNSSKALFGGNLVTSGTLYVSGTIQSLENPNSYIEWQSGHVNSMKLYAGGVNIIGRDAAGSPDAITINADESAVSTLIKTNAKMAFASKHTTNTVYINTDTASEDGADTNFWVSGSIGSKNTITRGTSVFGGDVMISGSMTTDGNSAVTNAGVILTSPDGSGFKLTVDNSGNLTTTAL